MKTEWIMLLLSVVLGLIHIFVSAGLATHQRGFKWNISPRDGTPTPLTGIPARVERANNNFKETFPLFIGALILVAALDRWGSLTSVGAQMYFGGRLIYFPLYAFGVVIVRTLAWFMATSGIVLVLFSLF